MNQTVKRQIAFFSPLLLAVTVIFATSPSPAQISKGQTSTAIEIPQNCKIQNLDQQKKAPEIIYNIYVSYPENTDRATIARHERLMSNVRQTLRPVLAVLTSPKLVTSALKSAPLMNTEKQFVLQSVYQIKSQATQPLKSEHQTIAFGAESSQILTQITDQMDRTVNPQSIGGGKTKVLAVIQLTCQKASAGLTPIIIL